MIPADVLEKLEMAQRPEDLFGPLETAPQEHRKLAKLLHPDTSGLPTDAAFKKMEKWWKKAQLRIARGAYGDSSSEPIAVIQTKKHKFTLFEQFRQGDIANLYLCEWDDRVGVCKIARNPRDNDLVRNEATHLRAFDSTFMPSLVESFVYQTPDRVQRLGNVLAYPKEIKSPTEWYSLKEVRDAYPSGIAAADMAWMWRRLLYALHEAHSHGSIHGAVLPTHILIQPTLHGLALIDWSYAVEDTPLRAISAKYEAWYPADALKKQTPLPGLDIFMGARCMIDLLGGDAISGKLPDATPTPIRAFFKGCLLSPRQRPQDAHQLQQEFDDVLERLYGRRRFRKFSMP